MITGPLASQKVRDRPLGIRPGLFQSRDRRSSVLGRWTPHASLKFRQDHLRDVNNINDHPKNQKIRVRGFLTLFHDTMQSRGRRGHMRKRQWRPLRNSHSLTRRCTRLDLFCLNSITRGFQISLRRRKTRRYKPGNCLGPYSQCCKYGWFSLTTTCRT